MADQETDRAADDSILPLIFGTITLLSLAGLFLSRRRSLLRKSHRAKYMPPNVVQGTTQDANTGEVIPGPVGPPPNGSQPVTLKTQYKLLSPIPIPPFGQKSDSVLLSLNYSYLDKSGNLFTMPLTPHTFHPRLPDSVAYDIPQVASDWMSLKIIGTMTATYADGPPTETCSISDVMF